MLIKLFLFVIALDYAHSVKNPCKKNGETEFFPHPDNAKSYIQCSKRGEMFLKECKDGNDWIDEEKKCGELEQKSQVKTLAAKFKIKKLIFKAPVAAVDMSDQVAGPNTETNSTENIMNPETTTEEMITTTILPTTIETTTLIIDNLEAEATPISDMYSKKNEKHEEHEENRKQQEMEKDLSQIKQDLMKQKDLVNKMNFWESYFRKTYKHQAAETSTPATRQPMIAQKQEFNQMPPQSFRPPQQVFHPQPQAPQHHLIQRPPQQAQWTQKPQIVQHSPIPQRQAQLPQVPSIEEQKLLQQQQDQLNEMIQSQKAREQMQIRNQIEQQRSIGLLPHLRNNLPPAAPIQQHSIPKPMYQQATTPRQLPPQFIKQIEDRRNLFRHF